MVQNLEPDLAAKTLLHLPKPGSFLSGNSALHSAAAGAHIELCRDLLLQDHLNINIKNDFGQTPIHFAAAVGAKDIIGLFVDHGARVGAEDLMGQSSFYYLATGDSVYSTEDDRLRCLDLMHPSPQLLDALAPKLPTQGRNPRLQKPEVDALGRQSTSVNLMLSLPDITGVTGSMLAHAWSLVTSPEGNKKLGIGASALHMFRYDLSRQDELLLEGAGAPGHKSYYTLVGSPTPLPLNPLTPFLGAVMSDRLDLAIDMAEKGSIVTRKDAQGHSAAHIISRTFGLSNLDAQIATLRRLCELGLDMQDKDIQLRTPLFHAISAGNIPIIEYLMEQGADLETQDAFGRTVYHHLANAGALLWNQKSLVQRTLDVLLSKPQSNLTIKDVHGLTAVSLALENEWTWGAERLLQAGALRPSPEEALRILHKVLRRVMNQGRATFDPGKDEIPKDYFPEQLFDLLISFGAVFDNCWPVDQSGIPRPLLCTAVFASDVCMVQYLCKRPIDVHALGHSGLPPIFIALASPHNKKHEQRVAILHALLNAGANADEYRQNMTPLSYIVMMMDENKAELASIFIQHGANVNLRMSTRQSYTELAVMFGREQLPLIKTLLLAPRKSRLRSQDTLALIFDEPGIEHYQMPGKGSILDEIPSFSYKGYFKRGPRRKHSFDDLRPKSVWPA
jgi:ankyrin repeat protein